MLEFRGMKNAIITILVVLVLVLGYLWLKGKGSDQSYLPDLIQEEEVVEKPEESFQTPPEPKEERSINEDTQYITVDIKYPFFGLNNVDQAIKGWIDLELRTFKSNSGEGGFFGKNFFNTKYEIRKDSSYTNIIFTSTIYKGGAHENIKIKSFVVSQDEDIVSIGSIFKPGTDYLNDLSTISRYKLQEKYGETLNISSISDGTKPISSNFETFYIQDNVLTVIFQPYQVGPWAAGVPEIEIDLKSEMSDTYINQ